MTALGPLSIQDMNVPRQEIYMHSIMILASPPYCCPEICNLCWSSFINSIKLLISKKNAVKCKYSVSFHSYITNTRGFGNLCTGRGRLSSDWSPKNLFSHACPLLAAKPLLSHLMLAGLCEQQCVFNCLDVLEIHTSTFAIVVKYNFQNLSIVLIRYYLYTLSLHTILHGGKAVESFIGSILTVQCYVKQRFKIS
jgi:hypothetical protein